MNRVMIIRASGKAHTVFKLIALLAKYKGHLTLEDIRRANESQM